MPTETLMTVGGIIAVGTFLLFSFLLMAARFYRQVDQGKVLIVNTLKAEPKVTFTGAIVLPIINRAEVMDISLKTIEIDRRGKDGLICLDNIRADIKVTFFVRVNKTREDVLKVAQSIGCVRASDDETLEQLFEAKFSEALKTVGKHLNFEDLYNKREDFKNNIIQVIGHDLNGYMLEDAAIDFLEQTPLELLDKDNILDAVGIRKITELTAAQHVLTNELRQKERMEITERNVDADQKVFDLERQRAEAAARQRREIDSVTAREAAETAKIQAEEHMKAELARIRAEEEIQKNEQNKCREVEVAEKNRERVVGIEAERVHKDRALEALAREREVELQRIAKDKALETEKKAIADVVRTRIAVDKTVAQEEELIKDLRVTSEANRFKDAAIIKAEAEAQEHLVKQIKAAEASGEVAKFRAKERLVLAEAELEAADKEAKAKSRIAEGVQAEEAAHGLAEARVKEADALATEKQGMAQVRVQEAEAGAIQKRGMAEAHITKERMLAEAAGIQEKLSAEARGLAEKAEAMKALDGVGREHEEYRLRLSNEREIALGGIHARRDMAEHQSKVLAEAFKNAKFNIVGGDGQFFERFVSAVGMGKSLDGALENSESLQTVFKDYISGDANLAKDVKDILSKPGIGGEAQNVALAALLSKIAANPATLGASLKRLAGEKPDQQG